MRHSAFKSYDIRGRLGLDLDTDLAYRIGRGFARVFTPELVAIGRDGRESSPELAAALAQGLVDEGVEVRDLGLCGTEEIYFAADHLGAGGGLMVTASHNPIDYNGIKMVRSGARPISWDSGLGKIHDLVQEDAFGPVSDQPGQVVPCDIRDDYVAKVLSFADLSVLKPLKIVVNPGNGAAGPTFDALAPALEAAGFEFVRVHHDPDHSFPNGIPNPLLPENRAATAEAVRAHGADLGVAWDGDFDRCFLFDETGGFVDGEYIVALLAQAFLDKVPGAKIVHDPRVQWNTQATVAAAGGRAIVSRTGHALIKEKMREEDALYGGEMSAHHYFRDFMYCDSGMIPWLLVAELVCRSGRSLGQLVAEMQAGYPSSGEINFRLEDPNAALTRLEDTYLAQALDVDRLDGLSLSFADWRVNLRKSNTEPVLRMNIETRGDRDLLQQQVEALTALIEG